MGLPGTHTCVKVGDRCSLDYPETLPAPFSPPLPLSLRSELSLPLVCFTAVPPSRAGHPVPAGPLPHSFSQHNSESDPVKRLFPAQSTHGVKAKVAHNALRDRVPHLFPACLSPRTCPLDSPCPGHGGLLAVLKHRAHTPRSSRVRHRPYPPLESSFPRFPYGLSLTSCAQ